MTPQPSDALGWWAVGFVVGFLAGLFVVALGIVTVIR